MAARGKAVSGALDFLGLSSKKAAAYIDRGGRKATKYMDKGAKKVAEGRIGACCPPNEFSSRHKSCC
jgi:hypothetical protein